MTISSPAAIRPGERRDVPALARLRYEFRAGHDAPIESATEFLARCAEWMQARLVPGGSWRCWLAEEAGRAVGLRWGMERSFRFRRTGLTASWTDSWPPFHAQLSALGRPGPVQARISASLQFPAAAPGRQSAPGGSPYPRW